MMVGRGLRDRRDEKYSANQQQADAQQDLQSETALYSQRRLL